MLYLTSPQADKLANLHTCQLPAMIKSSKGTNPSDGFAEINEILVVGMTKGKISSLTNDNGVRISTTERIGNHSVIENAKCPQCGRRLIIAPKEYQQGHDEIVVMCEDFGHWSNYFVNLIPESERFQNASSSESNA